MDEIIYVSDYNHAKEVHLDMGMLMSLSKPMLLICSARNALTESRKQKETLEELMEEIKRTKSRGGTTLIPVDSCCRVLELAIVLQWQFPRHKLENVPLVLLSTQAYNVTHAASNLLEWVSTPLQDSFQKTGANPFVLPLLKRCHNREDLTQFAQRSMVVLASMPDLESGFARELFLSLGSDDTVSATKRGAVSFLIFLTQR